MWITVLVMAIAVSLEPFRIGMTVLMLNRPRPALQLLAFLGGGFAMGTTVGLVVLFVLRPRLSESSQLTVPTMQIAIGALALVLAVLLATNVLPRRFGRPGVLPPRVRHLLNSRSLWVAVVAGLGIALPSFDYLAVLAIILASGATPMTQVAALLTFNVAAFALVEIPLIGYLIAPDRTRALMLALNKWIRSRRRREVAAVVAGVGCVLIVLGLTGL